MKNICLLLVFLIACGFSHGVSPPVYFVDASAGNDGNSGTQALPWLTLHKINTTALPYGTTVNLQNTFSGGDNGLVFTSTNAPAGNITVQSYGAGAIISSGNSTACVTITDLPGMVLNNFTCTGGGNLTNTTNGVLVVNDLNGSVTIPGITIKNLTVSGYGAMGIKVFGANLSAGFRSVTILNNVVHDTTGNEVAADSCIAIKGTYSITAVHYNATVQGNLVFNCTGKAGVSNWSGSGIFVAETNTATVQFNVAHDFGGNHTFATAEPVGIWAADASNITMQFNEAYNGKNGSGGLPGDGFDFDGATTNSIMQYNYAHGNAGKGFLAFGFSDSFISGWSNNIFRYNVAEKNGQGEFMFGASGGTFTGLQAYNNTLIANGDAGIVGIGTSSGTVQNNIVVGLGGTENLVSIPTPSSPLIDHNDYSGSAHFAYNGTNYTTFATYKAGASQDANSITTAATLNGTAGTGGTCYTSGTPAGPQPCSTVYQLKTTSSAQIGVGVSIASPGSRDYYGNTIPNGSGTGYNIGAYGGLGVP